MEKKGKTDPDGTHSREDPPKAAEGGPPIDRGWAWVILVASCLNIAMSFGYLRSFGILFLEFLVKFQASTSVTALIMGIQCLFTSLGGFLTMNVAIAFFRIRSLVIFAGFLCFLGVLGTAVAPDIGIVIAAQSVLVGTGAAVVYCTSVAIVNQYFDKRRSMATAIATSGTNVGAIFLPLLMRALLSEFDLRGSLIILSGVVLNIIVAGSLLRPVESYTKRRESKKNTSGIAEKMDSDHFLNNVSDKVKVGVNSGRLGEGNNDNCQDGRQTASVTDIRQRDLDVEMVDGKPTNFGLASLESALVKSERNLMFIETSLTNIVKFKSLPNLQESLGLRKLYATSESRLEWEAAEILLQSQTPSQKAEHPKTTLSAICQPFIKILDFGLFRRISFWVFIIHAALGVVPGLVVPFYLPVLARDREINHMDIPMLVSISGFVTIVASPVMGFLADLGCMPRSYMAALLLSIVSVGSFFTRFFTNFPLLAAFAAFHSVTGAVYFSLIPVLIVDFFGIQNFSKIFGFNTLFQGIVMAISHPLCGYLRDVTGSFDAGYIFMGISGGVALLMLLLVPLAKKMEEQKTPSMTS